MIKKPKITLKPSYFVSAAIVIAAIIIAWPSEYDTGSYAAYLESFSENTVVVDVVDYATADDKDKMKELGLTAEDMPEGYYLNNPDTETSEWKIDENTTYTFSVDGRDSISADEADDMMVTVTDRDAFEQYLNDYESETKLPFFFEVEKNRIISIKATPVR